jgi:hypothetical protein
MNFFFYADHLFTEEIVNLEEGTSNKTTIDKTQLESDFKRSVKTIDKKLEELNRNMFWRRFHNSLVMDRMRKDIDAISSTAKEDKQMITGMTSKIPSKQGKMKSENGSKTLCLKSSITSNQEFPQK